MPNQYNAQSNTRMNESDPEITIQEEQSSSINKTTDPVRELIDMNIDLLKQINIFEQSQNTNPFLEIPEILDDFTQILDQQFEQAKAIVFNDFKNNLKDAFKFAAKQTPEEIQKWENKYRENIIKWLHQIINMKCLPNRLDWDFILISSIAIIKYNKFNRPSDIHDIYLKITKVFGIKK